MLWWVVDNANGVLVVLGLVLLVLASVWWNTRRRPVGIAALVTLGLLALVLVLSFVIVTDRKQLTGGVYVMVDTINADKVEDAMKYFADEATVEGAGVQFTGNRQQLAQLARQRFQQAGVKRFVVWNVEVEKLERPN